MLQQTQVKRVIPKYHTFLEVFPTVQSLAAANLGDVLRQWSGLGYNRRAKFLWQSAQKIVGAYGGTFPDNPKALTSLPGIGINTAGAICAYTYNQPVVFIETNIRTAYIHHFFKNQERVEDKQLVPLIEKTLDREQPREFYWALMDYGSHLKQEQGNASRHSKHYTKQSKFEGSRRQIRGQVLRLLAQTNYSGAELQKAIDDPRLPAVLEELVIEGLITKAGQTYSLS
jgi:A/G-specific adenine glycosylase